MKLKKFLLQSNNIARDSFVWNMAGSMIMAFQSVILLMIITRTAGLAEAGIFTIANVNANLFLNIGKYGMRNYQVSDVEGQFSFRDYLNTRYVSIAAMLAASCTYVAVLSVTRHYTFEKSMVIIWMCLLKIPDAAEDVYFGEYQRRGRLDIASKAMTIRLLITIAVYAGLLILVKKQLVALVAAAGVTVVVMVVFLKWTCVPYREQPEFDREHLLALLKNCFPLFAGSFLSVYIGNIPKYAIDALLSDELQACYGFVSMPVFVIGLLNNFIFNPMLYQISRLWSEGRKKEFLKQVGVQVLAVAGITGVCILGADLFGIPVLSFLYHADLKPYKRELLILLLGGGFLGLSGLLNAVITIIRRQKVLVWIYAGISVLAMACANVVVEAYQMSGAAVLYTALMALVSVCFLLVLVPVVRERV